MSEVQTAENLDDLHVVVKGEAYSQMPHDLYIPPDALKVILDAFEGPLDLLLYLIKRQNLDILNIPIAEITAQYMQYIELMDVLELELAGEYLLMAAMLAEIKSRLLLPRPVESEDDCDDPRSELIRRLQEYERFKKAAGDLDQLQRYDRDVFKVVAQTPEMNFEKPLPTVELGELLMALREVLDRARLMAHHHIDKEPLSVRDRMSQILTRLQSKDFLEFTSLFTFEEGRMGVVVAFIAILELLKQSVIEIVQAEPFSKIHIRVVSS